MPRSQTFTVQSYPAESNKVPSGESYIFLIISSCSPSRRTVDFSFDWEEPRTLKSTILIFSSVNATATTFPP